MTLEDAVYDALKAPLISREGKRNRVYKDTLGYPTVGVGHKVLPEDQLIIGQMVTEDQIDGWLRHDAHKAIALALRQAKDLGSQEIDLLVGLAAANFQLGDWTAVFPNTWKLLKEGAYDTVILNLARSKWYRQTPLRVNDFMAVIRRFQIDTDSAKLNAKKRK